MTAPGRYPGRTGPQCGAGAELPLSGPQQWRRPKRQDRPPRSRPLVALFTASAVLLVTAAAGAHVAGLYHQYLNNPEDAYRTLAQEMADLEAQLDHLGARAREAEESLGAHRDHTAATIRFYDTVLFGFSLHALFSGSDLVDLLAHLRVVERMVQEDVRQMEALALARQEFLLAREDLALNRTALANRERLLIYFQESDAQRQAFLDSLADPALASLALALDWQANAGAALDLIAHVEARLRRSQGLFREGTESGTWVLTQEDLTQHLTPLPSPLAQQVQELRIIFLPDHVYWITRHDGRLTLVLARFERHDRPHLRLTLETVLYRGFPVPEEGIATINALRPLLIDLRDLAADAGQVEFEPVDGALVFGRR